MPFILYLNLRMIRSKCGLFFLALLAGTISGCSHNYGIYKTHAFFRTNIAGIVRADDNNKTLNSGVSKEHLIYLESSPLKGQPSIESVLIDAQSYKAQPVEVQGGSISLGKLKNEEKEISIQAAPGNQLWQLVLSPSKTSADSLKNNNHEAGMVVLKGMWNEKPFTYKIKKQQQLAAVLRP